MVHTFTKIIEPLRLSTKKKTMNPITARRIVRINKVTPLFTPVFSMLSSSRVPEFCRLPLEENTVRIIATSANKTPSMHRTRLTSAQFLPVSVPVVDVEAAVVGVSAGVMVVVGLWVVFPVLGFAGVAWVVGAAGDSGVVVSVGAPGVYGVPGV